jgi:hypothetical protein
METSRQNYNHLTFKRVENEHVEKDLKHQNTYSFIAKE